MRASPSVGHGDNPPGPEVFLRALALEVVMQEKLSSLREAHKRVRASIEQSGVNVDDLKTMYSLRMKTEAEAETWIRRKFAALSAVHRGVGEKMEFRDLAADEHANLWRHKGRMAGVNGAEPRPLGGVTTEEVSWWMDGYHQGSGARQAAEPVLADILAEALETAERGEVADGTTTSTIGRGAQIVRELEEAAEARAVELRAADEADDGAAAARLEAAGLLDE